MFVIKAVACSSEATYGELLTVPSNIRLASKNLTGKNTLGYSVSQQVTKTKDFVMLTFLDILLLAYAPIKSLFSSRGGSLMLLLCE